MRYARLIKVLSIFFVTVSVTVMLDVKVGQFPPMGRFLDPMQGFWRNSEQEALSVEARVLVPSLREEVRVYWDSHSIPHVVASNDHDLYLMQGYLTAFHRLWQMDIQVRKTAGRLSEIFGEGMLEIDRLNRRKGFVRAAEKMKKVIVEDQRVMSMALAFTQGVNDYINSLDYEGYPLEYKLLDYEPELWSVHKTCLFHKEMSSTLSLADRDLAYTNLVRLLGKETFDLLFPDRASGTQPIVPAGTRFDFDPLAVPESPESYDSLPYLTALHTPAGHGSSNMAVAKAKSATGRVLVGCQPDLDLQLPSSWYVMHLKSPTVNVMGGTLPGFPGVIVGFNDSIAWGLTNAARDLSDWYHIRFADETRREYHYEGSLHKAEVSVEEIQVRGWRKPYSDTLITTHHGPVVYEKYFPVSEEEPLINLALKWTGHEVSREMKSIYLLNRAQNMDEFYESITYFEVPPQNICFGHAKGDIGMWVQGRFPLKWKEQGKFVMDGSDARYDWKTFVPQEHVIHETNPERGFVSSANEHPADETYPYYMHYYNFDYHRGRRVKERLEALSQVRVEDLMELQNDNFNYIASELLPFLLDSLRRENFGSRAAKVYEALAHWDYMNKASSVEAVYFQVWYDILYEMLWDEVLHVPWTTTSPSDYVTSYLLRNNPDLYLYDRVNTTKDVETRSDLINRSYQLSLGRTRLWQEDHPKKKLVWSNYRRTQIHHLLRLAPFSATDIDIGGYGDIVNAVKETHGPSLRFLVSLDEQEGPSAWMIYPGGQSGNPGNASYMAWVEKWARGEYIKLVFSSKEKILSGQAVTTQAFISKEM